MLKHFGFNKPSSGLIDGEKVLFEQWWILYQNNRRKDNIYIYIYMSELVTLVEGDPKVPFSIATTST